MRAPHDAKKIITIESAPNGGYAVYDHHSDMGMKHELIGAYSSMDDLAAALRPLLYEGRT